MKVNRYNGGNFFYDKEDKLQRNTFHDWYKLIKYYTSYLNPTGRRAMYHINRTIRGRLQD